MSRKALPKIIPFPASRRIVLVGNAAAAMLRYDREKAETHLQQRLSAHAERLRAKGIAEAHVAEDCRRYEAAVRAAIWRALLGKGGAA